MPTTRLVAAMLLTSVAALLPGAARADAGATASVVFVLDCSAHMAEPWQDPSAVRETSTAPTRTRFDAAVESLRTMLSRLADDGNYEVGVVLYGHRLAWEGADEPELIEQTEYLDQTLGYSALASLMPGDDVEVIQPLGQFREIELETVLHRLGAVRPWGENPLYYALVRAGDAFSGRRNAPRSGIVVLTSGHNHQWLARNRWTKETLSGQLEKRHLPIHFIGYDVDPSGDSTEARELASIAEATAGSFEPAGSATLLAERLTDSMLLASTRRAVEPPSEEHDGGVDNAEEPPTADEGQPSAKTKPAVTADQRNTLQGRVVLYSEPIRRATVAIQGGDLPPVTTDRSGAFLIRDVPPGKYQLRVEAIAYNTIYKKTHPVTIHPAPGPGATVEINLAR